MEENESPITETRTCARCGKEIGEDYVACPYCGKKVKGASTFEGPILGVALTAGASILLFLIGMIMFFVGSGRVVRFAAVLLLLSGLVGLVYIPFGLKLVKQEKNKEVPWLYFALFTAFAFVTTIVGILFVLLVF